ncbi:MAG: cysteine desulfurase [Bacteroidales bacterium]|nr:cysteine desulfurase [Bacteroidales bacterium]
MQKIYLDYNATTPIDKEVAKAMLPYLTDYFGNPSSTHNFGYITKKAVENARKQLAALLNCLPDEIIFTSGGTESNNYAIKGSTFYLKDKGKHIITSSIEHPAVLEVCKHLESHGFLVTYLPVDEFGRISIPELEKAIRKDTVLITIMHANNEIGTIQPIDEISKIAKKYGIRFHSDAAQSFGKVKTDVQELGLDLMSVAGHKFYAPKGVGALYIRKGTKLEKFMHGANHEQNLRAGTVISPSSIISALHEAIISTSESLAVIERTPFFAFKKKLPNIASVCFFSTTPLISERGCNKVSRCILNIIYI